MNQTSLNLRHGVIQLCITLASSNQQETFQWMFTHIAVVRDLVAMQYKEYQEVQHRFNV